MNVDDAAALAAEAVLPSPCRSRCCLDEQRRQCVGCGRTLEEINAWLRADFPTRARIRANAAARLAARAV